MRTHAPRRSFRARRSLGALAALLAASAGALAARDAHAQAAGLVAKPLPNVLLLVDTSGSMERMADGSLPRENRDPATGAVLTTAVKNACVPGTASNPNRWGMLVQALTGNLQPFYSCAEQPRTAGSKFAHEFKIDGRAPYDIDYALPHHRPLAGSGAAACAVAPYALPGAAAGRGVGPSGRAVGGTSRPEDFPAESLTTYRWTDLNAISSSTDPANPGSCSFDQAADGQLDVARDYVRFSLMTFDTDPGSGQGVSQLIGGSIAADPFAGLWSYLPHVGGVASAHSGNLPACPNVPFELGARNWAAPPWEGRHVPFPSGTGTLLDVQTTNDRVQRALAAARPFGATPIDGMFYDARDYLWRNPRGPEGSDGTWSDPYVKGGCRDQYVILLTDGAPNLDMRPACEATGGACPYPKAWEVARDLHNGTGGPHTVRTFVIGFSVNGSGVVPGDGFPTGYQAAPKNNCKVWFDELGGTTSAMAAACTALKPPTGTTASACCELNRIAAAGSNGQVPAFFAESQADLVLAFGRILGSIAKGATTRTVPAYSPTVSIQDDPPATTFSSRTATFVSSFSPSPLRPWSGSIERDRVTCVGGALTTNPKETAKGDFYDQNLAAQAVANQRRFVTVRPDGAGTALDGSLTIRPFAGATPADGVPGKVGTEVGLENSNALTVTSALPAEVFDVDATSCKRSKDVQGRTVPPLTAAQCAAVSWSFATAYPGAVSFAGYNHFNTRCAGTGSATCAVSGLTCSEDADCGDGDTCVPACSALGAIFRSTPAVVPAPYSLARDEGYRGFATAFSARTPAFFVATTDGILHAFKALHEETPGAGRHELFAFVPPAVLPKLRSNYPTGQQVLLDGAPVVGETVWERTRAQSTLANKWRTTLVAGMGQNGPGYYALNVTDLRKRTGESTEDIYEAPAAGDLTRVSNPEPGASRGAHFLWQLTDVAAATTGETGKPSRTTKAGTPMVALFGKQTGTPAITTLYFDPSAVPGEAAANPREIGVAVLPGGMDGPAEPTGDCPRATGTADFPTATFPALNDPAYPPRPRVRQWGTTCAAPVAGRSLTIVRLDTGEIIRHFARPSEAPRRISARVAPAPFDSPIVGTPVVYPSEVGAIAQRAFVGDADGTLWRIDLSSANPNDWKALLFHDTASNAPAIGGGPRSGQPMAIPPVLALGQNGEVTLQIATGDQETLTTQTDPNFVYSLLERPPTATLVAQAQVRWFVRLADGERVTGPMATFDRTLYFATYRPPAATAACQNGNAFLWGLDYLEARNADVAQGGEFRWCPSNLTNCTPATFTDREDVSSLTSNQFIPGVSIRATPACADVSTNAYTDYFQGSHTAATGMTGSTYSLFAGVAAKNPGTNGSNVVTVSRSLPSPKTPTRIDAWATLID